MFGLTLHEVAKVFQRSPENYSTVPKGSRRPDSPLTGVPVMAVSSDAGVQIGISPDLVSLFQENSNVFICQ